MWVVHVFRSFPTVEEAQDFADKMTVDGRNTEVYLDQEDENETSH